MRVDEWGVLYQDGEEERKEERRACVLVSWLNPGSGVSSQGQSQGHCGSEADA